VRQTITEVFVIINERILFSLFCDVMVPYRCNNLWTMLGLGWLHVYERCHS